MIKTPEALRRFSRDGTRHYKGGGGGGDGGAAARDAAEKARVAQAVEKINAIFAIGKHKPDTIDQNAYTQDVKQPNYRAFGYQSKPISVPEGYQLITKQVKNTNPFGNYRMGIGEFNQPSTKYELFNKAAYDKAVADSISAADKKNAEALQAREGLYTKIGDDTKNTALIDLNKDRDVTQRDLGFMLARSGLSGGSRDVDVNRDILDAYNQGVLKAANMGTQTSNNARSADDQTRVKLIQNIQAGLDEGQAAQQAYEGMANNARAAQDDANSTTLKGFFDILNNQQKEAAYTNAYNQTTNPYAKTSPGYGKIGGAYNGTSRSFPE